jgi:hypothetical protein
MAAQLTGYRLGFTICHKLSIKRDEYGIALLNNQDVSSIIGETSLDWNPILSRDLNFAFTVRRLSCEAC